MSYKELLKQHGYTREDIDQIFSEKINELKKKKYVREKLPLGEEVRRPVGRFVTLRQSDYPIKMFVMRELRVEKKEPEVRIGYYIISKKILRDKGRLSLQWGQFNPSFPKRDLKELLRRAEKKGIL